MSHTIKSAALAAVTRLQPSTFYERENRPNPILQAMDQELKLFFAHIKRRSLPGYTKHAEEPSARPANMLSELWNKYQPRLPALYYEEKLLQVGDFLVSIKEYHLALWQCYERYLQPYGNINVEEISDVETFQTTFYKTGLHTENAGLMSRAVLGKSICMYHIVKLDDPKLQNKQSVERCVKILSLLQLVTQVVLPKEALCWLVYNGTIHIYTISRYLMSLGHSSRVLEYLLWSAMVMETSVPLLTAKYLSWRATLYTAVCQCYSDCKAGEQAEIFARRSLVKIHELSNLELISSSKALAASEDSFRSATVRMAVMVFKRIVFETRRKPKGILRPKTRANLKDVLNLPWPRTPTESLLAEMFDGGSAQFLAILESLSDSNRRILQTSPPASDSEPEILDVYCELMMAAQEILAGGGGNRTPGLKSQMAIGTKPLSNVTLTGCLIQMATKGEENVPLEAVIRLVKLAYCYEHWDLFATLISPIMAQIKESKDEKFSWDEKALELLSAMEKCSLSLRPKKQSLNIEILEVDKTEAGKKTTKRKSKTADKPVEKSLEPAVTVKTENDDDELIQVAAVLMSIVSGPYERNNIEIDLVVDATLFLWSKCKLIFQKYQTGSVNNPRFLQKIENPAKWIQLLETVHQSVGWCEISSVDPLLAAEVVLRLAMVKESIAKLDYFDGTKSAQIESRTTANDSDSATVWNNTSISFQNQLGPLSLDIPTSAHDNLLQAKKILQLGLANVNSARRALAQNDGKNIVDVTCIKEHLTNDLPKDSTKDEPDKGELSTNLDSLLPGALKEASATVKNSVKDLHLELILMYHRICLKLSALDPAPTSIIGKKNVKQSKVCKKDNTSENIAEDCNEDFTELCNQCKKNHLSKALLLAQRAVALRTDDGPTTEQNKLLEDAVNLVQRVQMEEKKILSDNTCANQTTSRSKLPPPPILLCRTDTYMVFRPAPFEPESGEKVAWYRIFARCASGPNVKVRLSDNCFPGTGEEVPSFHCEMKVANLEPNERYVFAVAAYTANGKLIGEQIGDTTKPFLASHPLPVLMTWALISQMAYQVGHYSIARQASGVLWDHFVEKLKVTSGSTSSSVSERKKDFKILLRRLNQKAMDKSSPVLLRHFLTNIFINTDIAAKEGQLFCDVVCDKGKCYDNQIQRLQNCEKLLVAVELAGWLNEASLALQTVVQMYGLLAPMLFHKIPSIPILQILQRCHTVLVEIPPDLVKKRQGAVADNLNHMMACIIYHLAKGLRAWGQKDIANNIIESGLSLLAPDVDPRTLESKAEIAEEQDESTEKMNKQKKTVVKKTVTKVFKEIPTNEEARALEAYMMSINQSAIQEIDLQSSDDPSVLHAYIACLPSSAAFKEVEKFKLKPQYLEFLVHVSQKGLMEGIADQVLQWCNDGIKQLTVRNAKIFGSNSFMFKQPGAIVLSGDDPKKFAAAMVEYKKDKGNKSEKVTANKNVDKKRAKYKPLRVRPSMSEASQKKQEEAELKALETLNLYLVDLFKSRKRRKTFRKTTLTEMPWRSQLNFIQGLSHFNLLLQQIEKRERMLGISVHRTNSLDHEWFSLETAGVLIVGYSGGPSSYLSLDTPIVPALEIGQTQIPQITTDTHLQPLIELVAAVVSEPAPAVSADKEPADSPRTYRSEKLGNLTQNDTKGQDATPTLTAAAAGEALKNTFTHFKRSMVLAHRGQHWTLLQNAGRALWNCAHTALLRTCIANQQGRDPVLMTTAMLWSLMWHPLYVASDCLLDMMTVLQDSLDRKVKSKGKIFGDYFESWAGTIQSEQGGASLKFDPLLDDTNMVDTRWIRRLILKTLQLLCSQSKFEKLVDIAMRFNALTNNRFAEQILPLVVQAQRQLKKRINMAGGASPPQPHFKFLQAQLGHIICARDYLKAQLLIQMDKSAVVTVNPGVQIDPIGHGGYSKHDAFRLSSVPLDTAVSLRELSDTLDQSHYTARAMQHSRKLLCLYLAGQQNVTDVLVDQEVVHVDFKIVAEQPHPTVPANKMTSDYSNASDVQFFPLPQSQLGTVINSYEKTIEMLHSKNQKSASAQAMHELGNIYFHAQNSKAALYWWCQSLDLVLNTNDAIHVWRSNLQKVGDISSALLDRCGLWGCLLAGILASNIAQYIITDDDGLRIECCLLSGYLFKSLFRSSIPHPKSDWNYALYDVGEGCEVTCLTPGIDFLSDRFRCDGRQLVAALKWVTEELSRAQYNLFVLPLLTLRQYFTTCVCPDVQQTVESRILRVRILTDLGFYSDAITALQQLLNGERLQQTAVNSFRQKDKKSDLTYNISKTAALPNNIKVIESLLNKRLSFSLSTLFGPHLTCHLALVQAHLLVSLANTIPVKVKMENPMQPDKAKQEQQTLKSTTPSKQHNTIKFALKTQETELEDISEFSSMVTSGNQVMPPDDIKRLMLAAAEQTVTNMTNVILNKTSENKRGAEDFTAAELELLVQCQLEQARVAQQKQHAPIAAHIMLSALKMLQDAWIFKKKKPQYSPHRRTSMKGGSTRGSLKPTDLKLSEPENNIFQYQNLQARIRLDTRLWLQCRYELVRNLMMEIRGMGEIKSGESKVVSDLADCRQYCAEGLGEAEACVNLEMQAHFLFLGAQLNIIEGKSLKHTISLLEDAIKNLHLLSECSDKGEQLLVSCIMFKADLEAIVKSDKHLETSTLVAYLDAQRIILKRMELLGEIIEHQSLNGKMEHKSSPISPLKNVYLPCVQKLVEVKLRIGHTLARKCAMMVRNSTQEDPLPLWTDSLQVLTKALDISQSSALRDATLESEILLMMGKIQKMMVYLDTFDARQAADTLINAYKISYTNSHDLGLMRQVYLEIALTYLYSTGLMHIKEGCCLGPVTDTDQPALIDQERTENNKTQADEVTENEKERKAVCLAIQYATSVAHAQRSRNIITGDKDVVSNKLEGKAINSLPDFLSLDLLSRNVLGKEQKVYKNEVEEEIAILMESQEVKDTESYETQVKKIKASAKDLSWTHLLGYQTILQRLVNTATFSVSGQQAHRNNENGLDLDSLSHANIETGINHNVVRYMLHSGDWSLRLAMIHSFLFSNLNAYAENCTAPRLPPEIILPMLPHELTDVKTRTKSFSANVNSNFEAERRQTNDAQSAKATLPPSSNPGILKQGSQLSSDEVDPELSVQWYQPVLGENGGQEPDTDASGRKVILLYALVTAESKLVQGFKWVALDKLYDLHDRLAVLAQKADIFTFVRGESKPAALPSRSKNGHQRKKSLSSKLEQDEQLRILFKQCLDDAWTLMKGTMQKNASTDPEFNIINVKNLENIFDPNLGLTLRGTDLLPWLLKLFT